MWIHIMIFLLVMGITVVWRTGWVKFEGLEDTAGRRLFVAVALGGNLLGMLLTFGTDDSFDHTEEYRLDKEESGSYEEKFLISVDGEREMTLYVQVPEKETGEAADLHPEEEVTEEEQRERELRDAIARYNQEKNDPDYYYLPEEWDGRPLVWKKPADHSGNLVAALSLFAAVVVMIKKAREKQEAWIRRSEQLLMDYPGLVMKFTLLVQAGMTVRRAFQKIALDYRRSSSKKGRYAYEEIEAVCREMDCGVSEAEAYRRFGERCGQIKYKTLAALLVQNLQKGSRRMSEMLEREAMEAWDERKRRARVLGEAAATKLLFPMMLMLVVVMAVVMIPAFLSFYG